MKSSRWRNGWRRRRRSEIRLRDHAPGGMPGRFLFRWRCVFVDEIFGLTPSTGLSPLRGLAVAGLSQRLRALLMNFDATRRSCQRGRERFHPPSHGDTEKFWIGGLGFALSVTFCSVVRSFRFTGEKRGSEERLSNSCPLFQAFLSLRLSQIRKTAPMVATIISEISPPEE